MSTSTAALCDAPPAGGGSVPHVTAALAEFRGAAAAEVKSAPLASVSTQPSAARVAAVVLSIAGATAPSKSVAPAVADEIGYGSHGRAAARGRSARQSGRAAHDRHLAAGDCEVRGAGRVRCGEPGADRAAGRELDEIVAPRRDGSRQHGHLPRRPGRGCVLHRPAAHVDGGRPAVEELDEVVRERRTGVPAAGEDLTDEDVRRRPARGRRDEGAGHREEAEEDKGQSSVHVRLPSGGDEDSFPDTVLSTRAKEPGGSWHRVGTLPGRRLRPRSCRRRQRD